MAKQINDKAGDDYFMRINTQMLQNRQKYGIRNVNKRAQSDDNSRRQGKNCANFEFRAIKNLYKLQEPPPELFESKQQDPFLGVKPEIVVVNDNAEKWMDKHQLISGRALSKKTIKFAKNLFLSWDDDGSGVLEEEEIIHPLIAMGLASDSDFARQLISTLDPKANKPGHNEYSLTLRDFVKIFNTDKQIQKIGMVLFILFCSERRIYAAACI